MSLLFDPRQAPKAPASSAELSPVAPGRLHPEALRQRFAQPPIWTPDIENEKWFRSGEPVHVPASVLVPLVVRPWLVRQGVPGMPSVLLTQRTAHLKAHAGQISFPGGRSEPDDRDAVATALREAQEEVGLPPERVEILGRLPTYVTGTGFSVTPVVGLIQAQDHEEHSLDLRADPSEVADIFEVPLDFLMDPANHEQRIIPMAGQEFNFFAMPWIAPQREEAYFIWGATAAMLRNFYRFLSA